MCIVEYMSWEGLSNQQRFDLSTLYGPYLALSVVMGLDMYSRLGEVIARAALLGVEAGKKTL